MGILWFVPNVLIFCFVLFSVKDIETSMPPPKGTDLRQIECTSCTKEKVNKKQ